MKASIKSTPAHPDTAETFRAMDHRLHVESLFARLLAGDDDALGGLHLLGLDPREVERIAPEIFRSTVTRACPAFLSGVEVTVQVIRRETSTRKLFFRVSDSGLDLLIDGQERHFASCAEFMADCAPWARAAALRAVDFFAVRGRSWYNAASPSRGHSGTPDASYRSDPSGLLV
jgi:hypothetical protein